MRYRPATRRKGHQPGPRGYVPCSTYPMEDQKALAAPSSCGRASSPHPPLLWTTASSEYPSGGDIQMTKKIGRFHQKFFKTSTCISLWVYLYNTTHTKRFQYEFGTGKDTLYPVPRHVESPPFLKRGVAGTCQTSAATTSSGQRASSASTTRRP